MELAFLRSHTGKSNAIEKPDRLVYNLQKYYTSGDVVRTNIELDDELMAAAQEATGLSTKKAIVEEALRDLVTRYRRKKAIESLAGLGWEGDLQAMRRDRPDNEL